MLRCWRSWSMPLPIPAASSHFGRGRMGMCLVLIAMICKWWYSQSKKGISLGQKMWQ
ncbi:hypothetical protein BDV36DRAFT_269616 [Aspergillus pseudocaelatus]|uniref:Uncharacterized protein n=1 Tax=Aspergillus pseudocaelatus TaxID=1825620 RepID=A0ABQ6W7D5_9EURO|nr:hypothetical protein BDV36DRAFT_269616 [Aspergillus pseudocaelatus]